MLVRATLILLTSVCLATVAVDSANRDVVFTVQLWWQEYVDIVFSWDNFQQFLVCLCGTYHPFCVAQYDTQNGNQTTGVATNGTEIIGWEEDQKFYRCFVEFWHERYDKLVCQFQVNGSSCADNRLKFQAFRVTNSDCGSLCTELSWDYSSINVAFLTNATVEFYPDSCECPALPNTTAAVPTFSTTTTTTAAAATSTTIAAVATTSTTIAAAATTSKTTAAAATSSTTEAVPTFSTRTTTIEATTTTTTTTTTTVAATTTAAATTATKTATTQPPPTTTATTTTTTAITSPPPATTVTTTTTSTTTTPSKPTTTTTNTKTPTSATIPTASSSTQTWPVSTTTDLTFASQSKDDTPTGVIVGVVIAVIVLAVVIVLVVYFVRRGKQMQYSPNQQKESSTSLADLNNVRSSPQSEVTDIKTVPNGGGPIVYVA